MIFIAEDEQDIREIYVDLLEESGFKTKSFSNGNEILQYLAKLEIQDGDENIPTLIITDLRMPERSGEHFIKTFRNISMRFKDVPIFVVSGFVESFKDAEFINQPNIKCFEKPMSADKLIEEVNLMHSNRSA